MKEVLDFAMSSEVRSQDCVYVISSVASSKAGRELAWNYFKENWTLFNERLGGTFLLIRLVKMAENFASEEKAVEIETFFKVSSVRYRRNITNAFWCNQKFYF